uniref:Hypothetical secreted peptide n=1 Tax=Glossina morsitans morsitans TaxID=37546 RepID=D3TSR1_GLOMM
MVMVLRVEGRLLEKLYSLFFCFLFFFLVLGFFSLVVNLILKNRKFYLNNN